MKRWIVYMDVSLIGVNLAFIAVNAYRGGTFNLLTIIASVAAIVVISLALWSYIWAVRRRERALQRLYAEARMEVELGNVHVLDRNGQPE